MSDGGRAPSVGRVVHYFSYGTPNGEYKSEARAAIVTAIHNEDFTVDICVMNPTGLSFNQKVKQGNEPGQWNWPPIV